MFDVRWIIFIKLEERACVFGLTSLTVCLSLARCLSLHFRLQLSDLMREQKHISVFMQKTKRC